ncbi:hypothetical protein CcaverHIS002_0703590 [Cutaneotrichosporon cavernicola]|uniref:Serine hydrolase domain-containing protein n=1 Tax=Cutaneotrichosporon cavernicola TaxID=279322 RepID=A0AA48QYW2_9TREE|nr:uncharacterized protein CcaverHIS019_0703670 [Cutaneotrichosporon cavernicola]BEI87013.1 hypothetical protein CcaverHIS002_0703590 [Cutaneotrichosporon cavernicola]BEI94786.1 hypothetical protein CcaverHIS019_0703670 [Cutaneotrichosporon cavernicola]BEJ02561.1 hypothetical protein CcaverHIS631_0703560 [Cutaneotrichosporon cavernicola]BEJ10318.1 hypothetical protein CcaverHIS641_0703530 [Cutaneotrichosporon cavernicola]
MNYLRNSNSNPNPNPIRTPTLTPTPPTKPKLRILCLHGALGSASVLRSQAAPLANLSSVADLVFVDAPALSRGGRGWFDLSTYAGLDETYAYLSNILHTHGPFDGVLGLSQGAVLASILVGWFDFAIMFGGFVAQHPEVRKVYAGKEYARPSLHVYGMADRIVSPESSKRLAGMFTDPTVVVHGGGHVIPSDKASVRRVEEFVARRHAARFG